MKHRCSFYRARALSIGMMVIALSGVAAAPAFAQGDTDLLKVSQRVPEFGGAYIQDGSLYIWLTKPSNQLRDRAQSALVDTLGAEFNLDNVVALDATYSFKQLFEWHQAMIDVLSIEGAVSTDIDERNNRLAVTVDDLSRREGLVEAELSKSGVPRNAVTILEGSPIRQQPESPSNRSWMLLSAGTVLVAFLLVALLRSRR